jgi:hypothetical protein
MKKTMCVALIGAMTFAAVSETYFVGVTEFGFDPSSLSIQPGDTVVWFNDDEFGSHVIRSDEGLFSPTLLIEQGDAAGFTFQDAGSYTVSDDLTGESQSITVENSSPITLDVQSITKLGDGTMQLRLVGTPGESAVLLASQTLTNWVAISTNSFDGSGIADVVDADATKHPRRFYQAMRLAN